jgi:putative transposase
MSRIQIGTGIRYVHQNRIYSVRKRLADDHYQVENVSTGEESIVAYDDLLQAWSSGDLRFEISSPNALHDSEVPLRTRYAEDDLQDLPQAILKRVWKRYALVLAVYQYHQVDTIRMLSRRQIREFVAQHPQADGQGAASVSSIERYLHAFVDSNGDIRSLIPQTRQQGGKHKGRLGARVEQIIEAVLADYTSITERVSTVDQVVTEVVNRIADENQFRDSQDQLPLPSERTIRRRIKVAGEKRVLGRRLSRREQQAESEVQSGPRPTRILERVEIDHTTLDLFVVDETDGLPVGRPHITACIDKYSGLVPGWHIGFNQGGYESIMLCLQHAILPKPDYRELCTAQNTTTRCMGFLRSCA